MTRRRVWISLLSNVLFGLLLSCALVAQTVRPHHTSYSIQDGLSNYWVNCLFQDRAGFLWIGTQAGLNRFDGYRFRQYLHRSDSDSTNRRNSIWAIAEDDQGNLWTGSAYGIERRDRKRDTVIHFRYEPGKTGSLSNDHITSMFIDADGMLWIGTDGGGLNILDTRRVNDRIARGASPRNEFKVMKHVPGNPNSIASNGGCHVSGDRLGRIWICWRSGVDMYDPRNTAWRHFAMGSAREAGTVYEDGEGNIWIAQGGLHRIDAATQQLRTVSTVDVTKIIPDGNGGLLLASDDVVYRLQMDNRANGLSVYDASVQQTQRTITAFLRDRTGSLWLGTERGLVKRDDEYAWFSVIKAWPPAVRKDFYVTSFCEDEEGDILVGTFSHGIHRILGTDTTIRMTKGTTPSSRILRGENTIFSIQRCADHRYAVGSAAGPYFLSGDLKQRDRIDYRASDTIQKWGNTFVTFEEAPGKLWFAVAATGSPQLLRYDIRTRTIDSNGILQRKIRTIRDQYIWTILKDKRGRMWIGMDKGLYCFNPSDSSLRRFRHAPDDPTSLSSDRIRSLLEDSRGKLYIGTWGGGMNIFDERTQTFTRYTKSNGLANNTVSGMLEDVQGNIWIATFAGFSRFNPDSRKINNYYDEEIQRIGFPHSHAFTKTRDGRFLFGGNGVLSFYPDRIPWDSSFATTMITSFSVVGRETRSEIGSGEEIFIPWKNNYFMLEYAALEFRAPEKIQYAYMLEGINTDWVYAGTQRSCSYTNVPPGDYALRIKATNSSGEWNTKVFTTMIHIVPPLYMTSWFRWTTGLLGVVCLVLLWNLRLRHLRKKEREKRYRIEAELQALRLQINPHFFFNSLNAIQSFVMGSDEELANEYISKFARLMRMVLETSRTAAIPITEELEMLELYLELESIRFNGRFQYRIHQDPAIDASINIPSMLMQPYAENAVRHGLQHRASGGMLTITVESDGDMLRCVVEDNGIGRERALELRRHRPGRHTSLGTSITNDRIEVLNSLRQRKLSVRTIDLYDEQHVPAGTRVEILVPIDELGGKQHSKQLRQPSQPESTHD